jgi:hypothetical protein
MNGRIMRNLNLAAARTRLDNGVLLRLRPILVGDLSRGLAPALPDALDRSDDLLVLVAGFAVLGGLVDLELHYALFAAITAIGATAEASIAVVVQAALGTHIREFGCGRLAAVGATGGHRAL